MKTIIAKRTVYEWLFVLCVLIPYFDNYELTISVWTFATLVTLLRRYSLTVISQVFYFIAIIGIASFVSLFKDYKLYFIIRDFTYLIKPVLGILLGYQLCKRINHNIIFLIVRAGFIFSLFHLFFLARGVVFFKIININDLRYFGGFFSDFEVFAFVILLFYKKFELDLPTPKRKLYTLIIGLSITLYLARTNFIQFGILVLALKGFFELNKRNLTALTVITITVILGYFSIVMINPKRNGPGIEAFLYKIKIIPEEALKTKVNRENWKDLNDNYRSYENIMTVKQMKHDGLQTFLFGKGIGSTIDLKEEILLGDQKLRFISILHNGYMTVLLKSGLLGVLLLLFSFFIYFKSSKSEIPIINQVNLLLLGMGVFMIMSYWVFMGFYFKADNKIILLGMLIAYREIILANNRNALTHD
jgi:hypothetical protein